MRVLVTGAAGGIGRATALRMASEGARLALADRDANGLAETVGLCQGDQPRCLVHDAADGDATAAMASDAVEGLGGLDAAICNAGIYRRAHFAEMPAGEWDLMIAVNLTSVARIVQAVLPALRSSRGNVVAVASTAALTGIAYAAHYAAAKAGLVALIRSLAVEQAPAGVRFNAVAPGRVRTGIATRLAPLAGQDESLLTRPPRLSGLASGGEPEDIASAIAYLASPEARFITGAVLVADGAQTLG